MNTLQIRTTVRDYDGWRAAFDKYERFRQEHGVRSYRVLRKVDDPHDVQVVLEFDDEASASEFRGKLQKVFASRQSQDQVVSHEAPLLLEVVGRQSW